jgi:hypothetical protein
MKPRFAVALCLLFLAIPAAATTVNEMSVEALAGEADIIVIGRAVAHQVRWVDRVLVTDVTIEVSEWIAGSGGPSLVVTLPGGADFDRPFPVAMSYPGAPSIAEGEDVFLFLSADPDLGNVVSGFSQGKFSIVEQNGQKVVSRDLTGTTLSTGTGLARGGPSAAMSLDEFRATVASALTAAAARAAAE